MSAIIVKQGALTDIDTLDEVYTLNPLQTHRTSCPNPVLLNVKQHNGWQVDSPWLQHSLVKHHIHQLRHTATCNLLDGSINLLLSSLQCPTHPANAAADASGRVQAARRQLLLPYADQGCTAAQGHPRVLQHTTAAKAQHN